MRRSRLMKIRSDNGVSMMVDKDVGDEVHSMDCWEYEVEVEGLWRRLFALAASFPSPKLAQTKALRGPEGNSGAKSLKIRNTLENRKDWRKRIRGKGRSNRFIN